MKDIGGFELKIIGEGKELERLKQLGYGNFLGQLPNEKVIEEMQRPTLIISPNKTLAAQTASEFKDFFPDNAVYYFVSYYDYFQPESYIPQTDTYIEKDSSRNEEIDRLRHSATMALFERRDVIIVASVSCIYGLGDPEDYSTLGLSLRPGEEITRDQILSRLVDMQYLRNDLNFTRDTFRVRGDTIDVFPASSNNTAVRIEMFGDEIESLYEFDVLTGATVAERDHIGIFPASHYVTTSGKLKNAIAKIKVELEERLKELREQDRILEAQRLMQRTNYDLEMMQEVGYCSGIENYSRHMSDRRPGDPPYTLLDYFPDDYLREETRKYIFISLLVSFTTLSENDIVDNEISQYLNIPQNKVVFYDFMYKNIKINYDGNEIITNFAVQYKEELIDGKVNFKAYIAAIENLDSYFGHYEYDAQGALYSDNQDNLPKINQIADFSLDDKVVFVNGMIKV